MSCKWPVTKDGPAPGRTIEILAPAGDGEMLRAAVYSGADCVYLGVSGFNARRGAANFDAGALAKAVAFCHARGCKVYAALNTLVFPGEEGKAEAALRAVAAAGADALIVQDLGVAALAQKAAPRLPLHGSTQMSVHSPAGARQLEQMGFERVILARELGRAEIAAIAAETSIELEVFVHGALCVAVSGQCYMSAFLGGRSANRGGCAGPCRLPFRAERALMGTGASAEQYADLADMASYGKEEKLPPAGEDTHALSLKDLSILDALPELAGLGVVSAKIEGRLRGPEYVAVAVDSALKARAGEPYDKDLLRRVFSRSGFTRQWYAQGGGQEKGAEMFGRRTEGDAAEARAALPRVRELYRRERPRVPVGLALTLAAAGGRLTVTDGTFTVEKKLNGPLEEARQDAGPALAKALNKTGGTPFYARQPGGIRVEANGRFAPGPVVGALRREALEELLALRERDGRPAWEGKARPAPTGTVLPKPLAGAMTHRPPAGGPLLRARFERVAQLPQNADGHCAELLLPLFEAERVPEALRPKTWLWLPRVLFGREEKRAAEAIEKTKDLGFLGYEAENLGHLALCHGLPMTGGFGLNLANAGAVAVAAAWGCGTVTLSPELRLGALRAIAGETPAAVRLDMLAYGHLPLMVTRACPLAAQGGCAGCAKAGRLVDRKGEAFPVRCAHGAAGVRTIYNPVPLWMADRMADLPADTATLYFTGETPEEAAAVLAAYQRRQPAATKRFTRGLYDRGTDDSGR